MLFINHSNRLHKSHDRYSANFFCNNQLPYADIDVLWYHGFKFVPDH